MTVTWMTKDNCYGNPDSFTIPHGGYARIYEKKIKVYKNNGDHHESRGILQMRCY